MIPAGCICEKKNSMEFFAISFQNMYKNAIIKKSEEKLYISKLIMR